MNKKYEKSFQFNFCFNFRRFKLNDSNNNYNYLIKNKYFVCNKEKYLIRNYKYLRRFHAFMKKKEKKNAIKTKINIIAMKSITYITSRMISHSRNR